MLNRFAIHYFVSIQYRLTPFSDISYLFFAFILIFTLPLTTPPITLFKSTFLWSSLNSVLSPDYCLRASLVHDSFFSVDAMSYFSTVHPLQNTPTVLFNYQSTDTFDTIFLNLLDGILSSISTAYMRTLLFDKRNIPRCSLKSSWFVFGVHVQAIPGILMVKISNRMSVRVVPA